MPIIATCTAPDCGRSWSGFNQCHCSICHNHFSTVKNFDAHKPGPRRSDGSPSCGSERRGGPHLTPDKMTRTKQDGTVVPLLKVVDNPNGPLWVSWSEDNRYEEEIPA